MDTEEAVHTLEGDGEVEDMERTADIAEAIEAGTVTAAAHIGAVMAVGVGDWAA